MPSTPKPLWLSCSWPSSRMSSTLWGTWPLSNQLMMRDFPDFFHPWSSGFQSSQCCIFPDCSHNIWFPYCVWTCCDQMRKFTVGCTQRARQAAYRPFSRYWTTSKLNMCLLKQRMSLMPGEFQLMSGKSPPTTAISRLQYRDCCVIVVVISRPRYSMLPHSSVILQLSACCFSTVLTLLSSMMSVNLQYYSMLT